MTLDDGLSVFINIVCVGFVCICGFFWLSLRIAAMLFKALQTVDLCVKV
jgi:hypothetical protein